jgi:hypothetical protein
VEVPLVKDNYLAEIIILLVVAVVLLDVTMEHIWALVVLVVEVALLVEAELLTLAVVAVVVLEEQAILGHLAVLVVAVLLFLEFLEMLLPQQQLVLQQGIQVEDTPIMYLLEQGV